MPTNMLKTGLLLALMTAIFIGMGALVGGESGMVIAFVMALVMNLFALWKSDSVILRLHGAREVDAASAPDYHALVKSLADRAGLPMPRIFIMESEQPNAFATGRSPSKAAVSVSTGLLRLLSREEVAGVVAHELAHVRNRDTLTMTIAASLGGAISLFANMLQFGMIFGRGGARGGWLQTLIAALAAPFAATIVQLAISRSREYQADRTGAQICGNPLWLASALAKIQRYVKLQPNPRAQGAPATAHLFIINPLTGRGMDSWFSTHPSTENRIAELKELAREMGLAIPADDGSDGAASATTSSARSAERGEHGERRGPWG
jgi:heat shock protein HtpX